MSKLIFFPTISRDAQDQFRTSADELLNGLLGNYRHSAEFYRSNPTPHNWHALVQVHTAWRVAFLAEEDGGQPRDDFWQPPLREV